MTATFVQVDEIELAKFQRDPSLVEAIFQSDVAAMPDVFDQWAAGRQVARKARPALSLDKAWHGVHYLLCGEAEPGQTLLSQAVLGGTALGEDDEGFSGYGPARYFTQSQVAELASTLNRPEFETECAARFDPQRMSQLNIYPGWRAEDADWVLDALRGLRDFYSKAAAGGRAIVTCLV